LAIGAATSPPVPPWTRSTVTATATRLGEADEPRLVDGRAMLSSAVPVLPATSTPSSAAAVPGALAHDLLHHRGQLARGLLDITRSACCGSTARRAPVGSIDRRTSRGSMRTPPLAIVCATRPSAAA
jgi:hypothetical protein